MSPYIQEEIKSTRMSEIPQLSEKLKKAISDAGKPTTAAKPLGRLDIDPYRHHRQFVRKANDSAISD